MTLFIGIMAVVIMLMVAGFVKCFLFDSKNRGGDAQSGLQPTLDSTQPMKI